MKFEYQHAKDHVSMGEFNKALALVCHDFVDEDHIPVVMARVGKLYKNDAVVYLLHRYEQLDKEYSAACDDEWRCKDRVFDELTTVGWLITEMLS